jgi:hypothetical protein
MHIYCTLLASHTYPSQLQNLLGDRYNVTNLGACGSTLQREGDSPYWERPQFQTLVNNVWDIIIIMVWYCTVLYCRASPLDLLGNYILLRSQLGTNDAKDPGDGGPNNWMGDCLGPGLDDCRFADNYGQLLTVVRGLGRTAAGPDVYMMIPPPLMKWGAIGANQTVINSVYPWLLPAINQAHGFTHPAIDVFAGLGGVPNWAVTYGPECQLPSNSSWQPCRFYCDAQSCDQCHPNDVGNRQLAEIVYLGLTL